MEGHVVTTVITALGQTMVLNCPVTGKPAVTVKCQFKDDFPLDGSQEFFTLKNNSLQRPITILPDEGRYMCEGTNGLGVARSPSIAVTLASKSN